jgi:4-amino-4-deoxy-L-arabinose transferase-like glycosyltransferase
LALCGGAAVLFLVVFTAYTSQVPYQPGFDDAEHVAAGLHWRDTQQLGTQGLFVRVPLWQVLLGTLFHLARPLVAIPALQVICVFATLAACAVFVRHAARTTPIPKLALAVPLLAFALAPQTLLYARHPVNELWIGALAAWVLALGVAQPRGAWLASGLAVGAAAMTKLSMGLLLLPALIFAWRSDSAGRSRRLACVALGAALVAGPCVALHAVQRSGQPLDNTSAYSLGEFMPDAWLQLGDPAERQRAGMASFRRQVSGDPLGYAGGALTRLGRWITRPATSDFALFVPGFPKGAVGLWEHTILLGLLALAVVGTTARTAPIWLFVVALPILCSVPVHVPFVPKLLPVFPCLLLAPVGLARLLEREL